MTKCFQCLMFTVMLGAIQPAVLTASESKPVLVESRKIWSKAPHNAFTDLIRFKDRWYCVFREGKAHVSPDGALRVLTSVDGKQWESVALLTSEDSDLRDAKFTITPEGQLMLSAAEAMHDRSKYGHQSLSWFSSDGKTWGAKHKVGDPDNWLWRTEWHKGVAYGFGYGTRPDNQSVRVYSSTDGKKFDTLVESAFAIGSPNETALIFLQDDTSYCLLRRDGHPNTGQLGIAQPPYTKWTWKDLGVRLGGPAMIRLPDGRFVAVVRLYDGKHRTSVCWLDPKKGKLTEALELPSGGDCSYAGLVWHEGLLWISYYSSHEGKTSIYLAKVRFES
ncbi:MAG: exo-alpha-sialidase [Pirellulales bacterium]|nr:exo-alpha-sialidase [Pirellulales bacterium]